MNNLIISAGISQLQSALIKQEKEYQGSLLYMLSNQEENGKKITILTIWLSKDKELIVIDSFNLKELVEKIDKNFLQKQIPAALLVLLPKFDFKQINELLERVTSYLDDLENTCQGKVSVHVQNVKSTKKTGSQSTVMIKLLVHRAKLNTDEVIEKNTLQKFIENLLNKIGSSKTA